VISRATTTVTIYRGEGTDEYGDPVDANTIVATGIPASILEQTVKAWTEVSTLPRSYRWAKMRVTNGTDIQQNDRVYDERTGEYWTIVQISARANPVRGTDLRVDLEMMG
jgi:hypothetical protein